MSAWNRKLWGVELTTPGDRTLLIGCAWLCDNKSHYVGEPTRALLFCTRQQARQWCQERNISVSSNGTPIRWRFRPVRVQEIVRKA